MITVNAKVLVLNDDGKTWEVVWEGTTQFLASAASGWRRLGHKVRTRLA